MSVVKQAPKQLVRAYLEKRKRASAPPPTPEEIRRQLGWGMLTPADLKIGTGRT